MLGRIVIVSPRKPLAWVGVFSLLVAATVLVPTVAQAAPTCGTSSGHTLCVEVANTDPNNLTGEQTVTVTDSPNSGVVFATWVPSGGKALQLIEIDAPSPSTHDYSFVWPTQKYLDASGTLSLQQGSISSAAVMIAVTLKNGNATTFQPNPTDWMHYLPAPWTGATDPHILAVGDGPSNEVTSNAVASRIAAVDPSPPLFLFLGDVYETGTFTEFRNHYGASELDAPGAGTLWGASADITQPTLGNHEKPNSQAFIDYWHGRPLFTSFTFGGTLFLDMNSSASMSATSAQYQFVQSAVTNPSAPNCIVAFWHIPAVVTNTSVTAGQTAMWALLANNGVDLLVTGHQHKMVEFNPLDADFNPTPQAHLVQLVSGAGGHKLAGPTSVGARVAWSKGGTAGLLSMTLNGAAGGNAATSIGWQFQNVSGNDLHDGSVGCGTAANHAPVVNAGPDQTIKLPAQATMQGSVTDDGLPSPPNLTSSWSQVSGPVGGTATFTDIHSPTTTVSFSTDGTYVLRLTGNDGALQSSDDVTVTVLPAGAASLAVPIAASADDAEESSVDGSVALANPALRIVNRAGVIQTIGLRFAGLSIPQGATIQSAYIQFQCRVQTTAAASLLIQGQAADNAATFAKITNNISSRARTSANVGWVPAPWGTVGAQGPDQQTPDLTSVMQEIVNRSLWASGNSMAFIITGTGVRTAEAFDGLFAPVLHVTYA